MALKFWKPDYKPEPRPKRAKSYIRRTIKPKLVCITDDGKKINRATQDDAFYSICAIQLPHVCGYCGKPILGDFTRMNCDHVFEKSKFPHLRYVIEDICPTCFDCHQIKTSGKYTQRMEEVMLKTAEKLISMGLLEQIGEPDCNRIKDWVMKPLNK